MPRTILLTTLLAVVPTTPYRPEDATIPPPRQTLQRHPRWSPQPCVNASQLHARLALREHWLRLKHEVSGNVK